MWRKGIPDIGGSPCMDGAYARVCGYGEMGVRDIPECAEVVEDKALIFKKSDVEDLREKLQEACDHPEMVMKMKNQAADFICEKYNWDEVVKETMKLYRRK